MLKDITRIFRFLPASLVAAGVGLAALDALAGELRLVRTGGSDYHGDGETYAQAHDNLYVPDEDAIALFGALGRAAPAVEG